MKLSRTFEHAGQTLRIETEANTREQIEWREYSDYKIFIGKKDVTDLLYHCCFRAFREIIDSVDWVSEWAECEADRLDYLNELKQEA